ncbi:MAG TPA: hypothetical protein VGT04_10615 [Acidobacteriaceae bacterium]|nr:hypothetical protein [Acidobacteriaceae bacterium]
MNAARALMAHLVDYAGLFPPAGLDMLTAARRYREYLAGEDRWALGRFVVPAAKLAEFEKAFEELCCGEHEPVWRVSVLASGDAPCDARAVADLPRGAMTVESVEVKVGNAQDAERFLSNWESELPPYVEFPSGVAEAMLPVLARFGARAKIRTGGVAAEAFPTTDVVADFLLACARQRIAFKATAGLHHAVRASHKLTYEVDSARATMHGFANVFLAAILAWRGEKKQAIVDTLALAQASAFTFNEESVQWLGFEAGVDEIAATRRDFATSYGSCSFTEPLEEARRLGWA